jgi:response regulator NasT
MDRVQIVSASDKGTRYFGDFFTGGTVDALSSAEDAQGLLNTVRFDLVIVDTPLSDEFGTSFAVAAAKAATTILIVKKERFEQVSSLIEPQGVIVVAKPLNSQVFRYILRALEDSKARIAELENKIDDIRVIDRAKLVLVSNLKMTEPQAHKHIERQAMDRRISRREVALGILRTYEERT